MARRKTTEEYVKELPAGYTLLEPYVNNRTPILHKHEECGNEWKVRPLNILAGNRCEKCSKRKTHESYLKQVPREYIVLDKYVTNKDPIKHKHVVCGFEWNVSPSNILAGHGCPACAGKKADKVYLVYLPELEIYKVGVAYDVHKRLNNLGVSYNLIWIEKYNDYEQARKREKEILDSVVLKNTGFLRSGNTETFIDDKKILRQSG